MNEFTLYEKMRCVERELKLRRLSYDHLVTKEKLTREKADYQLSCMQAIVDEYRNRWDRQTPQLNIDERLMV